MGSGSRTTAVALVEIREAAQRQLVVARLHRLGVERLGGPAVAQGRRPHGDGRAALDLAAVAEHPAGAAADELRGRERLVDPFEGRLGRVQVRARRRRRTRGPRGSPPSCDATSCAASTAPARGSGCSDIPLPMRTVMAVTILRLRCRHPASRSRPGDLRTDRCGQDGPRARARRAAARRGPPAGRRLGRRAAGLRGPGDAHRRADARGAGPPRAPAASPSCRSTRASARASTPGSRTPRSTALVDQGAAPLVVGGTGLYLRAALADLDLRPPPPDELRARLTAELAERGAPALHAHLAARGAVGGGGHRPQRRAARRPRPRAARARRARPGGGARGAVAAVDGRHAPSDAPRRPDDGP